MNTNRNSSENFNELVFENKNKAYGAYAIRKSYSDNVTISLVLSSAFFGILAFLAVFFTNKDIKIDVFTSGNDPDVFISREILLPEPKKPIVEPQKKVEQTAKTTSGQLVASNDPKATNATVNVNQNISKDPNPLGTDSTAKKEPMEPVIPIKITPPPVELIVDKMPVLDNMPQFITDNLKYPRIAVQNGTKGIVYVTFVVETDGSITDIKLLKGIGDGCEQEAMRVVGIMPKWEPGINKGKPVRVQCNLPVHFRLE